jgi:hypothetical protein
MVAGGGAGLGGRAADLGRAAGWLRLDRGKLRARAAAPVASLRVTRNSG